MRNMMRNIALVAYYGSKPEGLAKLILACQKQISETLGDAFHPYELAQIHATLISMERVDESTMYNLTFAERRNQLKEMDFAGFLNFVRTEAAIPFQIQLGGFQAYNYSFTSRGLAPYERSFSIQDNKAVLIGWPLCKQPQSVSDSVVCQSDLENYRHPMTLDQMRKSFQRFNMLHKYHMNPTDIDNDFYLRLGLLEPTAINPDVKAALESAIRTAMSSPVPIRLYVSISDLYLVSYVDETLPLKSTRALQISDKSVTPEMIHTLYQ
jgi:hypothetical protein